MTRSLAEPVLSRQALNRALLARQDLIDRRRATALEEIEHLVGMQAQIPKAPYVGLWSRVDGFMPQELSTLIQERRAVRLGMMRNTIHLMSSRDCLGLWCLFQPLLSRQFTASSFARALPGIDLHAVVVEAHRLLEKGPLTIAQLGGELSKRFSGPPGPLAYVVRHLVPIIQVPPRGLWGKSGQPTWSTAEHWLGRSAERKASIDALVLRYLAAFGPATISDISSWSGLSGLRPVVERLLDQLMAFRDERGRQLFDIPNAPRPDSRTPVPPRFLPEYDNILLGHADRTRVIGFEHRYVVLNGTFLLDGFVAGIWSMNKKKDASRLTISSFAPLNKAQRRDLGHEAERLVSLAGNGSPGRIDFAVAPARSTWLQAAGASAD